MTFKSVPLLALILALGFAHPGFADDKFDQTLLEARNGNVQAQAEVGLMYANGVGTKQNHVNAFIWMSAAKANGDKASAQHLQNLRQHMSLQEIVDGQAQAGRCIGSNYQRCRSAKPNY